MSVDRPEHLAAMDHADGRQPLLGALGTRVAFRAAICVVVIVPVVTCLLLGQVFGH